MKTIDYGIHREQVELDKQDILDFFDKQRCNTCPFTKECEKNQIEYYAITLCSLFNLI